MDDGNLASTATQITDDREVLEAMPELTKSRLVGDHCELVGFMIALRIPGMNNYLPLCG